MKQVSTVFQDLKLMTKENSLNLNLMKNPYELPHALVPQKQAKVHGTSLMRVVPSGKFSYKSNCDHLI